MGAALVNLAAGFVCLAVATGIGCVLLRFLQVNAPPHWRFPIALLSGVAVINACVTLALFLNGGVRTLRVLAAILLAFGAYGAIRYLNPYNALASLRSIVRERWLAAVVLIALALNLFIALAPSTKIDELYYHMLAPKRIVSDDGLRPYRQPYESAIYPQMAFQYGLSVLYACGVPGAGNVLSWGLGAALIILIIGTVSELVGNRQAGWLFGGMAVVGLYTALWHVTSGAHALGDLATVIAVCLCLLPEESIPWAQAETRLMLVCLAACTAALTKISLVPLCTAITLLACRRAARDVGWPRAIGQSLGLWLALYFPILIWSYIRSGSPFGLATASLFHSDFFDPQTVALLAESRMATQTGLIPVLKTLAPSVSAGLILAIGVVVAGAFKRAAFRIVLVLLMGQTFLIAGFLPHEFRFLGGLQFVVLIMAAVELSCSATGKHLLLRSRFLAIPLCLPWLIVQAYYAQPFIKVDLGFESRDSFLNKYVAFRSDFRILNRILPKDAILYVANSRLPSYYAPRPVIFTLKDLAHKRPFYRFTVGEAEMEDDIRCTELVYENHVAVSGAFRTPGRHPVREQLKVERCACVN